MNWNRVGFAVGLLVVMAAAVSLFHLLRDIDIGRVIAAIGAIPAHAILGAGLFVATGYLTLTFYDFFSLRTIGRRSVPYRIAALASFTSYSIGHNLGATALTGGAVRLRIYSAWGLSIVDVTKIAFVTGLTFWLGNAFVLGFGMIIAPEPVSAINRLPPWSNQAVGALGLLAIGAYLMWLMPRPRAVGRGAWKVMLPSAPLTLVQIGIGVLDLGSGAMAMFMLMPAAPSVDFVSLLVTFVAATLLGFISHAPGSLGVFEAAMLIALPRYQTEELLASLLVFRCLYFVLPLCLAVAVVTVRELWLAGKA